MQTLRWTSEDLEALPKDNGVRYEIIDAELYMTTQPYANHQLVPVRLSMLLGNWNDQSGLGKILTAPGIIFNNENNVAPDLI